MMHHPKLSKVASNDSFIKLLEEVDPKLFKVGLLKYIKEKGLTFNQREVLETVAGNAII